MIDRCHKSTHPRYADWGGRGITVCHEWREGPRPFIEWGVINGWQPGLEIDRIENDKGYSPENCRFVTNKEQAANRRPRVLTEAGKHAISLAVIASNKRRAHGQHSG